jgi:hypothetical protein
MYMYCIYFKIQSFSRMTLLVESIFQSNYFFSRIYALSGIIIDSAKEKEKKHFLPSHNL